MPRTRTIRPSLSSVLPEAIIVVSLFLLGRGVERLKKLNHVAHAGDARYNQRNSFFEVPCDAMRMQVNFRQCGE
jgi:hypothetical protein